MVGVVMGMLLGFAAGVIYYSYILTPGERSVFYIAVIWPFITSAIGGVVGIFMGCIGGLIARPILVKRDERAGHLFG
ncbi:MAG: hypothetical protein EOP06_26350 [Proteobacteria bacterium]|nr:MAG: hypothetical protein EOP06_26350 [Pseudomonadota bacterium]